MSDGATRPDQAEAEAEVARLARLRRWQAVPHLLRTDGSKRIELDVREAMRVAPVAYLMAPWLYCAAWCDITKVWYREFPGIHTPILLSRYERPWQLKITHDDCAALSSEDATRPTGDKE